MGFLFFIFFVGPYFALAFWVYREIGGMATVRSAVFGESSSKDGPPNTTDRLESNTTAENSERSSSPERTMDKVKGLVNEGIGNIKQDIGQAAGSKNLQAEGDAQELRGEAQKT